MKLRSVFVSGAFVLIGLLVAGPTSAAVSLILEIPGIPGESTNPTFPNQIDVFSESFGASVSGLCGAGALNLSDLNLMKRNDKASIPLSQALKDHTVLASATLRFVRVDGQVSAKYVLSNVLVSSWQASASAGGDDYATESLSLSFSSAAVSYTYIDSGGKAGATQTVTLTAPACP